MSANDCIAAAEKAAGGKLNLEQITEAIEVLQERQKYLMAADNSLSMEEAALRAADELGREAMEAAEYKKRAAFINARRRAEALAYLKNNWMDQPELGAESFLVGTNLTRDGARNSVSGMQASRAGRYIGGFLADIEATGKMDQFSSGQYDLDISRALRELGQDEPKLDGIPKDAIDLAKVIRKWQDYARIEANKYGAMIGKLDDYITNQSHDVIRLRRVGRDQWVKDIMPRLDPRTFKGKDPVKFLEAAYDGLVTGVHLKNTGAPSSFTGPRNIAKGMSAERTLHFKSADDWVAYNQDYGRGSLRESVLGSLNQLGESTALMQKLGTNPEANWNQVLDDFYAELRNTLDTDQLAKFEKARRTSLANRMKEVDGTSRIPVNGDLAYWSSVARAWTNMTSLGGAFLSGLTDVPVAAMELRYQGRNMLSGMGEMISGLTRGRGSADQRRILSSMGVYLEGMRGVATSRFSVDDTMRGTVSRMQNAFFRYNLQSWWTDTHRMSVGMALSNMTGSYKDVPFSKLPPEMSRSFEMYGINEGRWDLMRSVALSEAEGRQFMTTENFSQISDEAIAKQLEAEGRKATKPAINEMRDELASQLETYYSDRIAYAVLEPDARTRAMMRQGTQPGTIGGELLRFMVQFKSFSFSFVQKAIGRELYGRGYTPTKYGAAMAPMRDVIQAMTTGAPGATMLGMSQLMLWSTVFGYMAMASKDIVKGREPRDPADPNTIRAALVQGGGLGIYTDFIFGETNRFGGGIAETFAGPALGRLFSLVNIAQEARGVVTGEDVDIASKLFRWTQSNIPGLNLFYIKPVLDYMLLYHVQEWLNPGSLRRMEQRIQRENNQQFILRPSEVVQ